MYPNVQNNSRGYSNCPSDAMSSRPDIPTLDSIANLEGRATAAKITDLVFLKESWLSRRLELKELKAVLDVPDGDESGSALRQHLKAM
jgi:hypothetical protein